MGDIVDRGRTGAQAVAAQKAGARLRERRYAREMIPTISAQLATRVESAERTMRILWVALMFSVAAYGFAIHQIARTGEMTPSDLPLPPLVPPVIALSLAVTGAVLFRYSSGRGRAGCCLGGCAHFG
jgi:hypothetical protein